MAFVSFAELKRLCHPHYLINIILATSFIFLKNVNPMCSFLFNSCELEYKETEILFFAIIIIVFRTRKQGAVNLMPYISSACMFMKLANVLLYFLSDLVYGLVYITFCIMHLLLLPEPTYQGPDNIVYFRGDVLEEELARNKSIVWLIELYTSWSPPCIEFANCFAELSSKYYLDNLRFGKVDLSRNPDVAKKYRINTSALSKQLPTLILFRKGDEVCRRPYVNNDGKLIKFPFNFDNVVYEFDLNNIYQECKNNLSHITKSKHDKEE